MRFGCGERLPVHVSGEVCEACARAGFLVRPPPPPPPPLLSSAVVPKRMPVRRQFPRSRDALDLVRAVSLLRVKVVGRAEWIVLSI